MQRILIIGVVVLLVLAFMVTHVVRFNEKAVVTTFGRADAGSVITEPGLHFKLPYPFQKVTTYDTRIRLIQSDQETQQTKDKSQVILTSFMTWRVSDPLKFFKVFSGAGAEIGQSSSDNPRDHYREAEKILKAKLRTAAAGTSNFNMDDLLSAKLEGSKIAELEKTMLNLVSGGGAAATGGAALADYGIEPVAVGVSGIGLPQTTTKSVFDRMTSGRLKIANETIAQGESEAAAIRSAAQSDAQKISAFAEQLAKSIRTQGDLEAAGFYRQMTQDPQLATFLQNMDFYRKALAKQTTLVIPTSMPGFEMMRPDASRKLQSGRPPVPNTGEMTKPMSDAGSAGLSTSETATASTGAANP